MSTTAAQSLLIRHGLVIDPGRINEQADLLIRDGKIAAVGKDLPATQRVDVLDATGLWVLPGFVDLHVHLREPGFEYQETIQTGTAAAAAGGFTSICCMPNTLPVNDSKSITEFILDRAKSEGLVRVYPIGAITKRSEGKELSEYAELKDAGCVAVSDDGKPVMHGMVMPPAFKRREHQQPREPSDPPVRALGSK